MWFWGFVVCVPPMCVVQLLRLPDDLPLPRVGVAAACKMPRGAVRAGAAETSPARAADDHAPSLGDAALAPAGDLRAPVICRYYGTPEGCLRGGRCRWAHVLGPLAEDSAEDAQLDALMTGEDRWGTELARPVDGDTVAGEPSAGEEDAGPVGSDAPVVKEEAAPRAPIGAAPVRRPRGPLGHDVFAGGAPATSRGGAAPTPGRSRSPRPAGARATNPPSRPGPTGRQHPARSARALETMRAMEDLVQGLGAFSTDEIQFLRSALGTELRRRQLAQAAGSSSSRPTGARASRGA